MKLRDLLAVAYMGFGLLMMFFLASMAWLARYKGEPTGNEWVFTAFFVAVLVVTISIIKLRNPK